VRENWTTLETDVLVVVGGVAGTMVVQLLVADNRAYGAITVVFPEQMVRSETDVVKLLGKVVE